MSKADTDTRQEQLVRPATSADQAGAGPAATRVDAPHEVCKQATSPEPAEEATPAEPAHSESVAEQLRVQAAQLASHLRSRQKELDHREAQINARVAQLERDARTARLWLKEREAELNRRDEELGTDQREAEQRLARLATADAARQQPEIETRAKELADRAAAQEEEQRNLQAAREQAEAAREQAEAALQHERQQLESRREASQQMIRQMLAQVERRRHAVEARAVESQKKAAKPGKELLAREEAVRRTLETLQARGCRLDESEARLAEAHGEVQKLRQQLCDARRELQEEHRRQRQRWAVEQHRVTADLEKQRQAVQRRGDHVDQCRAALEELRGELGRMHRETLEIRLATEELWVQLSGAAPPAALTRSLGRIRTKLAEHYRTANAELHTKKDELESIRSQMAEQFEKLLRQKRDFEKWNSVRQDETQQQAARLVAREQQLDQKDAELADRLHGWQAERLDYQQEILRLRAQLSQREEVAVPA